MQEQERRWQINLNAFEAGLLLQTIWRADDRVRAQLKDIFKQLLGIQQIIRQEEGVQTRDVGQGMVEIIDRAGNRIVRPKHPWEREG